VMMINSPVLESMRRSPFEKERAPSFYHERGTFL
jgi:hypothetical protein